jgi:hypothetical protein
MQSKRLVNQCDQLGRKHSDPSSNALERNRSNLFGLSLRIPLESADLGRQKHLERIYAISVRRHGYNGHDPAAEAFRSRIRPVITHDHCRTPLIRLRTPGRIQVDNANFPPSHAYGSPSPTVDSQSASSPPAHSSHATSYDGPSSEARSSRTALCSAADRDAMPCEAA